MSSVVLTTPRLRLRPLTITDRDAFVLLHADPRVSAQVGSYDAASAEARLERGEQQWKELGYGMFAVELPTGELIGRCGLVLWPEMGANGETEIGWTLRPDHWGRGLATEAANACFDWAFATGSGHPGLERVTAMIAPGNERSAAVARRLGMTLEREDVFRQRPVHVFALRNSEHSAASSRRSVTLSSAESATLVRDAL